MQTIAVMPIYGRPLVTGFSLEAAKKLRGVDRLIVVGSTAQDEDTARRAGVEFKRHPNKPLGGKWQSCFSEALWGGADRVLFLGSDDWWEPDLLKHLEPYAEFDLVAPHFWGVLDVENRRAYYQHYKIRYDGAGTGRLYNARFIRDRLEGTLYRPDAPLRGMDWYATRRIEEAGGKVITSPEARVVSLKGCSEGQQIYQVGELVDSGNIITERVPLKTAWVAHVLHEWEKWVSKTSQS